MYGSLSQARVAFDAVDLRLLLRARGALHSARPFYPDMRTAARPGAKFRHFDFLKHLTQFERAIYIYVTKMAGAPNKEPTSKS